MKWVLCLIRPARCALVIFTEQKTKLCCVLIMLGSLYFTQSESYKPPSYIATCTWGLNFVAICHEGTLQWYISTVWIYENCFCIDCEGKFPCPRDNFVEEKYSPFRKGRSLSINPLTCNITICQVFS